MFCKYCGKMIPEGSEYCQYCGKSLCAADQQAVEQVVNTSSNTKVSGKKKRAVRPLMFLFLLFFLAVVFVFMQIQSAKSQLEAGRYNDVKDSLVVRIMKNTDPEMADYITAREQYENGLLFSAYDSFNAMAGFLDSEDVVEEIQAQAFDEGIAAYKKEDYVYAEKCFAICDDELSQAYVQTLEVLNGKKDISTLKSLVSKYDFVRDSIMHFERNCINVLSGTWKTKSGNSALKIDSSGNICSDLFHDGTDNYSLGAQGYIYAGLRDKLFLVKSNYRIFLKDWDMIVFSDSETGKSCKMYRQEKE